jgi:amino acid adenylation domain-containing protein
VKVRGFRIELGEVEAVLSQHPAFREAVVIARSDEAGGEKRLVAYVVTEEGQTLTSAEMREYLKEKLPDYMVPAQLVSLDELPLTPNGKVDRRALPAPEAVHAEDAAAFAPPETAREQVLASAWAHVLGVERVGVNDNFFDLGGDSIRSIQIRSLVQKQGYDFSLQQLFQHQTIGELSPLLTEFESSVRPEMKTAPFSLISARDRERMPEDVEDAYPIAMLQMGMLFHNELSRETPIYHDIFSFHLRAPFDEGLMREALSQLMNRHAVLRTSFDLAGYEEPLQLVHRHVEAPLEIEDLRALSADEQRRELDAWIEREKGRHFDLALPPYIRFGLFRRSDDTFQFALSFHHAILDGWSLASMLTELFTLYTMLLDPLPQPLAPPPTLTYRDFIALERDALGSGECQLFWTERLTSDAATTLPRWPGFEPEDGRRLYEVRYTPGFVEELRIFARASGVPLKSVLLAAHVRVLSTVSGQAEVVTGLVTNGRHEGDDGERVLGLFLNTVPFSMRVGAGTWAELAQAARDAEREIIPFRRFPLARMQQEQGGRSLFETNFNFVHFHVVKGLEKFKDLSVISAESFGKTNFTLSVSFTLDPDTSDLLLHIDYDTSVVSHAQVEAMGRYFERAFAAMTREPFARQDREPLLSEDEAHRLLVEWNETYADYPPELCVHQVFEAQAAVTPDAAAVVFEGESLTYRELNERANQLAHYLRRLGVGPEVLVGVLMERSLEMVVALFAVLKAGGAYVPLDPDYPGDRLTFMLHDSRVPLVLTQEKFRMLLSGLSYDQDGEVVVVDSAWDAIAGRESRDNPESGVTAENLIYVIYTSGSTGKPKGAMLTHGGIVNCLLWMQAAYGLDASDAFLFKTSLNFDPSVWELFWPLWFGGRVVVARPGGGGDSAYLMELAEREKVTSLYLVPSLLAIVVEDPALERVTSLRRVISGGEKLPTETIARFISRVSAELHHSYGPTETSIAATEWTCRADYPLRVVPMGRPLANTRVYILDSHMQPSPIGVPGELFIGGEGVGRGYLGRRDLTAARFIPDPFTEEQGARLYRTGDLARYLPDGQIEFVGRVDDQVKVRGYRIELGEIEAALREHRGVRDCVVAARADGGAAQLVAYVVPEVEETATSAGSSVASDGLTPNDLRLHLRMILPDYMVPSAFVFLDALPLTPSGKVDRRALPAPDAHAPDAAKHVAPRTPAEEIVAGIWTEVLGLSAVGATDDFFELGGHSLLATQVVSRVRESFGVELPLTRLFENSTVEGLAAHVEALARDGEQMVAPPIRRAPRDEELPLSFAQQRQWFLHQLDPEGYAYNIPAAVRLRGELHVTALEQTFAELVRRHESLRTVFAARGGVPVQIINPPAPFSLEVEDLSGLPDEATREARARELAAEEARRPFDLTRGPLLRASLLRLDESYQVLLLTMHHIVSDAWSLGVLIRDMVTLYEAFTKGEPSPLSELSVQYADYARWQREWLRGEVLEHQLAYWKKQLGGNTAPLELPADHEAGAVGYRGASLNFNLSTELTEQLKTMSRREGVTLFMTLLAVFKTLLHFQTGRDDITIGANVAGRNRAEIENLIGFFVNPLVLRTSVSGDPAFTELLGRVRETALGAYAHQDVPFEKLVEAFGGDRDPTRSPLFQIAFTLDNTPQQSIQLTRLELSVLDVELETTPFNLVLAMTDTGPGLVGSFQYNTEVFEGATIARLLRHFEMLLSAVAERPDARLSELREALAAGEQQRQAARQRNLREARSKMLRDAKKPATKSATQGGAVS